MLNFLILIPVAIIIFLLEEILGLYLSKSINKPPMAVRISGMLETAFGIMIAFIGGFFSITEKNSMLFLYVFVLMGIIWIIIAIGLYKANIWARRISLVLSIIRIPTIIGALFSIITIPLLFFTSGSKNFFKKKFSLQVEE